MNAEELQKTFSANLKAARTRMGFSQMKLAEVADLSVGYIGDLESCRRWGTPETFSRLAHALGISPHELLIPLRNEESTVPGNQLALLNQQLRKNLSLALDRTITEVFKHVNYTENDIHTTPLC